MTTTLLFLVRDGEILLAMKKRGFGVGKWNGVGGKLNARESVEQALIRECQEEIGVTPKSYLKVAEHVFEEIYKGRPEQLLVHTYVCDIWEGDPTESEEMSPQWFKHADIPYDNMWPDDRHWLPEILAGKTLRTKFTFDEQYNLLGSAMQETVFTE